MSAKGGQVHSMALTSFRESRLISLEIAFWCMPSWSAAFRAHDMTLLPLYVQQPAMWPKYQFCMLL
jgi:hypothetical protein